MAVVAVTEQASTPPEWLRDMMMLPGAKVSGFPALVLTTLIRNHLPAYLPAMSEVHRTQLRMARAEIASAAELYKLRQASGGVAVNGTEETGEAGTVARSVVSELTTTQAAAVLRLTPRRVCQLAERQWAPAGLARKVGRAWLIDPAAVDIAQGSRSSR